MYKQYSYYDYHLLGVRKWILNGGVKMQIVNFPHPSSIPESKSSVDHKNQCSFTESIFHHEGLRVN